jgi:hypothetical protein
VAVGARDPDRGHVSVRELDVADDELAAYERRFDSEPLRHQ